MTWAKGNKKRTGHPKITRGKGGELGLTNEGRGAKKCRAQ